jgi:hypothetical protein
VVAHAGKPLWTDTAIAYQAFYHALLKGKNLLEATVAMNAASCETEFLIATAVDSKKAYLVVPEKVSDFQAIQLYAA